MDKRDFTTTFHCESQAHCGTCRGLEGGRSWRKQIAERFRVESVDWPCPKGYEWGYDPPEREVVKREPVPSFIAERQGACMECDERDCFLKRLYVDKPCAFRSRIVRPGMVCPLERWP